MQGLMQVLNKSFASFYNKKSTIITLTNKTAGARVAVEWPLPNVAFVRVCVCV